MDYKIPLQNIKEKYSNGLMQWASKCREFRFCKRVRKWQNHVHKHSYGLGTKWIFITDMEFLYSIYTSRTNLFSIHIKLAIFHQNFMQYSIHLKSVNNQSLWLWQERFKRCTFSNEAHAQSLEANKYETLREKNRISNKGFRSEIISNGWIIFLT